MSDPNDYIGIRGWCATVLSIKPTRKEGSVAYVVGKMTLLPHVKNRDIILGGKNLSLDVYFHCYREEVALKFYDNIKVDDTLIVSGDLNSRNWLEDNSQPTTNLWLDEFVVDASKHTVSPLAGKISVANELEYLLAANHRYDTACVFCGGDTTELADHVTERMYCNTCDV